MATTDFEVTRSELAALLGWSADRVSRLIAEGMPTTHVGRGRADRTRLDVRAVLRWWVQRTGPAEDAKRRRAEAQAELAEIEVGRQRNLYITKTQHHAVTANAARIIRAGLENLPSQLCGELAACSDPHTVFHRLDDSIRACLISIGATFAELDKKGTTA